jgi:hypothetical protein
MLAGKWSPVWVHAGAPRTAGEIQQERGFLGTHRVGPGPPGLDARLRSCCSLTKSGMPAMTRRGVRFADQALSFGGRLRRGSGHGGPGLTLDTHEGDALARVGPQWNTRESAHFHRPHRVGPGPPGLDARLRSCCSLTKSGMPAMTRRGVRFADQALSVGGRLRRGSGHGGPGPTLGTRVGDARLQLRSLRSRSSRILNPES